MVQRIIFLFLGLWFLISYIFSISQFLLLRRDVVSLERQISKYKTGYIIYSSRMKSLNELLENALSSSEKTSLDTTLKRRDF